MIDFWRLISKVYDPEYLANSTRTKASIVEKVLDNVGSVPKTMFFAAYNPIAEILADKHSVFMETEQLAMANNPKIQAAQPGQKFDCVIALDEHLTYFAKEQEQKNRLTQLADLCDGWLVTTLCDYKNLAPYKNNQVEVLHDFRSDAIFLEQNSPITTDKQSWNSWFYAITDHVALDAVGPIPRRTMYFKQLAKYASDLGSTEYVVQKNTLYRGYGRKHWEHIITIRF